MMRGSLYMRNIVVGQCFEKLAACLKMFGGCWSTCSVGCYSQGSVRCECGLVVEGILLGLVTDPECAFTGKTSFGLHQSPDINIFPRSFILRADPLQ